MAFKAAVASGLVLAGAEHVKLTYNDCGSSSTHTKVIGLKPDAIDVPGKAAIVGSGTLDSDQTSAHFSLKVTKGPLPFFSGTGNICEDTTFNLPLGTGSFTVKGLDCPLKAGNLDVEVDLDILSEVFDDGENSLLSIHIDADADDTGDQVLCLDVDASLATLALGAAGSNTCGSWCSDNGHWPDGCDCGICGSFGACTFSCTEGAGRVACPQGPEPTPTPTPPAPTPTPPAPTPPAPPVPGIEKKGVKIGGLVCDTIQTGTVFYPTDTSKKYPLLSFAHGWTEGGGFTDSNYKDVLESVAAAGYVVIAHHSGLVTECQPIYPKDQQRALAYIKETDEFASRVDWDSKHGIYGHSMGGGATGDNAGNKKAIDKYNLGAAVLLHPVATNTKTLIPAFYATGSIDTICSPSSTEKWSKTATEPTIFAEMKGADHFECQSSEDGIPEPAGWTNYVINWFNCHLKGMQEECDAASDVCSHPTKQMTKTKCRTGSFNSSLVV